ncbi:MAG: VacJ family lipoprotein [Methylococcales bacterium]|nr:VacJ family lipoprotein [Methylococcales bacterium]
MRSFFQNKNSPSLLVVFLSLFLLVGCANKEVIVVDASVEVEIDPYEGFNRKMFGFNELLDDYLAEPVVKAYIWITPQFVRTGVSNFFNNLEEINVVLNDVMQGKLMQSASDTGRFLVNSTVGLGGMFDVAIEFGLERHEEDFAQTLAVWGVPQGSYWVLPVFGPITSRGIPGGIFDIAANPASYAGLVPVTLLQMLDARASVDNALSFIDNAAIDTYVFTRESFLQYRNHLITDGKFKASDDLLDFEDDFYEDDDMEGDQFKPGFPVSGEQRTQAK